ncbi:MAG: threonine transporter RhtB [marine bacterium B5-7]|nr:MAG: threonine transporter RhtB [marine bacterium B5-7]
MISFEDLAVFFAASIALGLTPGPDNIFVLTQSALYGRLAGLIVTLGLCTGLIVHTTAVSLGVAAIFQTSATAFNILKIFGAMYLVYLAWRAFHASASKVELKRNTTTSMKTLYVRGFVMNISNPKVAIFFLAFLPQFSNPSTGSITIQMFILGGLFILATVIVFGSVAWTAGYLGQWLRTSGRAQVVMNKIAGTVFIALAIRLATAER